MNTEKLAEILQDQAMETARDRLDNIRVRFLKEIKLYDKGLIVKTVNQQNEEVRVDAHEFLIALNQQLLANREKNIKAVAIKDFLTKFESFQSHMLTIEQYAQDMVEGQ